MFVKIARAGHSFTGNLRMLQKIRSVKESLVDSYDMIYKLFTAGVVEGFSRSFETELTYKAVKSGSMLLSGKLLGCF